MKVLGSVRTIATVRRWRSLAVVFATAALISTGLICSPATAASHQGRLQLKGVGSYYSGPGTVVAEAVAAGTTDQFALQVVNTGTTVAQYNIKVVSSGLAAKSDLYTGSLLLTPLASSPDGYYTVALAPGKAQTFALKVVVPKGTPQGTIKNAVSLHATDGTALGGTSYALTEIKPPTYGSTSEDLYARQGSQAWVGDPSSQDFNDGQTASAPALKIGDKAVFSVKVQNDGPDPSTGFGIAAYYPSPAGGGFCSTFTIKDGTRDVTNEMVLGAALGWYAGPALAVHASKTFTVTATRTVGASCSRANDQLAFQTEFTNQTVTVNVPYAVG
jgi:hypothetical protein